jgi:hypothetical protein
VITTQQGLSAIDAATMSGCAPSIEEMDTEEANRHDRLAL